LFIKITCTRNTTPHSLVERLLFAYPKYRGSKLFRNVDKTWQSTWHLIPGDGNLKRPQPGRASQRQIESPPVRSMTLRKLVSVVSFRRASEKTQTETEAYGWLCSYSWLGRHDLVVREFSDDTITQNV